MLLCIRGTPRSITVVADGADVVSCSGCSGYEPNAALAAPIRIEADGMIIKSDQQ